MGHPSWTSTIDESVWPVWKCAQRVVNSFSLCKSEDDVECLGACDEWSKEIIESASSQNTSEINKWHQVASMKVV